MVSKNQIKFIQKLSQKKYRNQYGLFVVEGKKSILEFFRAGFSIHSCYTVENIPEIKNPSMLQRISFEDLSKLSFLKHPDDGVAVFYKKQPDVPSSNLIVALDDVRDPGNLGTIIRLCDWFGISDLVCSEQTVDCYNPKVVQATMGSLTRVRVSYKPLKAYLQHADRPVLAAVINGDNIYKAQLPKKAILVMGNEANGISDEVLSIVNQRVAIPRFGEIQKAESLNVATSTAILLSELSR